MARHEALGAQNNKLISSLNICELGFVFLFAFGQQHMEHGVSMFYENIQTSELLISILQIICSLYTTFNILSFIRF